MAWYWWILGYLGIGTIISFLAGLLDPEDFSKNTGDDNFKLSLMITFFWPVIFPCIALEFGNFIKKNRKAKKELKLKQLSEAKNKHII